MFPLSSSPSFTNLTYLDPALKMYHTKVVTPFRMAAFLPAYRNFLTRSSLTCFQPQISRTVTSVHVTCLWRFRTTSIRITLLLHYIYCDFQGRTFAGNSDTVQTNMQNTLFTSLSGRLCRRGRRDFLPDASNQKRHHPLEHLVLESTPL